LVGRLDRRQWRHGGEGGDFRRRCSGRRHAGRAERWVAIEGGIRIDPLLQISSVASAPPLPRPNTVRGRGSPSQFPHRVAQPPL
jgi:hypothetical protein